MLRRLLFPMVFAALALHAQTDLHHALHVTLNPVEQTLSVVDTLRWRGPLADNTLKFVLNSTLSLDETALPVQVTEGAHSGLDSGMDREDGGVAVKNYTLTLPAGSEQVILHYSGRVHHPIVQIGQEYARGFSTSPGLIDARGTYLAGATFWVPTVDDALLSFDLTVSLPETWDAVSQGRRTQHVIENRRRKTRWASPHPMEEVFLIAAPFHEYSFQAGSVAAMAFLRSPDENLANKYLETTAQYLEMYRQLIGPFPFSKFALVENFWETGYGMPSFTLLGEKVIRFPFILHSSYPHELLHNWWGNSVFVDFEGGNWCEGITAYMADHLIKEQRGQGADYRRATLQRYTDYVNADNDFPVAQFISRTDAATEAVGYGKALMTYEMLRQDLGDENFKKVFQQLNRQFAFKKVNFDDIRQIADAVGQKDYKPYFDQWIHRTGAPTLKLSRAAVSHSNAAYTLSFDLSQVQDEAPFALSVPAFVYFKYEIKEVVLPLDTRQKHFELSFDEAPLRLDIDPQFKVMRRLDALEIPPALSKVFGAESVLIVLPQQAPASLMAGYEKLAQTWAKDPTKQITVKRDSEVGRLPSDAAVWVLGRENRFAADVQRAAADYDLSITETTMRFGKTMLNRADHAAIMAVRHPQNPRAVMAWLTLHTADAVDGLLRKLPHYGKYSYLAFTGDAPDNSAKGQWRAVHSPLSAVLSDTEKPLSTTLPKRPALAVLAPVFSAERMAGHVGTLASPEMEGRGLGSEGLEKAAHYIATAFERIGLKPIKEAGYFQTWEETVDAQGGKAPVHNIIGVLPGINPKYAGESVIVCAHYDHLGLGWPDVRSGNDGQIHPGADDNASGVAVMLELAETLAKTLKPERSIVFLATTAEEAGLKGARHYIESTQAFPVEKCIGVLNLDTVGRLFNHKLMVLSASSAREWRFIFMGAGYVTGVDAEMVTQPLDASDQGAFIEAGVPGVQFFTGPHADYHRPGDTFEKIDTAGLVKVAAFVREGVLYLASRETPLTFQGAAKKPAPAAGVERKATTGSMPDFSYQGKGVRIGAAGPDSPAAKAGLKKGDVMVSIDGHSIRNLRDYSTLLKQYKPGDTVTIGYMRDSASHTAKVVLAAR